MVRTGSRQGKSEHAQQTACRRCGICCHNGGPALHGPDLLLVRQGKLPLDTLITIRRGELVHHPLSDRIEVTPHELVKIRGVGQEWCCCYYDAARKGCAIYENRPLACEVLKCWQPEATMKLVGQDLLNRQEILGEDHPWYAILMEYEQACPGPDMAEIQNSLNRQHHAARLALERLIRTDLAFRERALRTLNLSLNEELFLFGRPLLQLVKSLLATKQ